jgi:cytochrome b
VTAPPSPSGPSGPAGDITRGDAIVLGLFLACWALSLLSFTRVVALAGSLPLTLYSYYGVAVALGWAFGIVYVRRTWGLPAPIRRRFLLIYYLGPPAILGVLRSMAPWSDQHAAPFVPLYAFGVFSILFLVPVTMKFPRPLK